MKVVRDPETGRDVEFPDCGECRDRGWTTASRSVSLPDGEVEVRDRKPCGACANGRAYAAFLESPGPDRGEGFRPGGWVRYDPEGDRGAVLLRLFRAGKGGSLAGPAVRAQGPEKVLAGRIGRRLGEATVDELHRLQRRVAELELENHGLRRELERLGVYRTPGRLPRTLAEHERLEHGREAGSAEAE